MSKPSVVLLDYGSGNLRSGERALARVGADVTVGSDLTAAREADGLVVPGVGAFSACMDSIRDLGADAVVQARVAAGRPVLGICVGMQVMYQTGEEHGSATSGISVLPGRVKRLRAAVLPHIGWSTVSPPHGSALFAGVEQERFYFVHSYGVDPTGTASGETLAVHDEPFVAAVERGVLSATQFHPEKSGDAGLSLLTNWVSSLG